MKYILILTVALMLSGCSAEPEVKAGQVWKSHPKKDPFSRCFVTSRTVIAVKDGYVQYSFVGSRYGDKHINSTRVGSFRIMGYLQEEEK